MGFGEAAINLQTIYQIILDMPWYFNKCTGKYQVNPKFYNNKCFWKVPIWYLTNLGVLCVFLYCLLHIRTLLLYNYDGKNVHILELIVFFYAVGITTQALVTSYVVQRHAFPIIYSIQGTFSLAGVYNVGWPTSQRLPDLQELLAYLIAFGSCILPPTISVFSLFFDFDPINIELKDVIPFYARKSIASVTYLVLVFYATNICILFILLLVATCHLSEKIALENLLISECSSPKSKPSLFEKLIQKMCKHFFQYLEQVYPKWKNKNLKTKTCCRWPQMLTVQAKNERFKYIVHSYSKQQILMNMNNKNIQLFVPTLASVGVYLCVVTNVGLVKGHKLDNVLLLIITAVLASICMHWLIVFLTHHAASPAAHNTRMLQVWRKILHRKEDRLRLGAMPIFGYNMGNFAKVTKATCLDLIMMILDTTLSVLMS